MLTWLKTLFTQENRSEQRGAELERATQAEDSAIKPVQIGRRKLIGIPGDLPGVVSTVGGYPAESPEW